MRFKRTRGITGITSSVATLQCATGMSGWLFISSMIPFNINLLLVVHKLNETFQSILTSFYPTLACASFARRPRPTDRRLDTALIGRLLFLSFFRSHLPLERGAISPSCRARGWRRSFSGTDRNSTRGGRKRSRRTAPRHLQLGGRPGGRAGSDESDQ